VCEEGATAGGSGAPRACFARAALFSLTYVLPFQTRAGTAGSHWEYRQFMVRRSLGELGEAAPQAAPTASHGAARIFQTPP